MKSSILINIAVIIKIGDSIIIQNNQARISNILFTTFHQLSKGVFLISITGMLFISESVVFVLVISNVFVIYLYLIQKVDQLEITIQILVL